VSSFIPAMDGPNYGGTSDKSFMPNYRIPKDSTSWRFKVTCILIIGLILYLWIRWNPHNLP
jgi:hypothetical protein